jgi:hypothetical protein
MNIKPKNKHYVIELTAEELSAINNFVRPLSFSMKDKNFPVKLTAKEKEIVGEFVNNMFCVEPV